MSQALACCAHVMWPAFVDRAVTALFGKRPRDSDDDLGHRKRNRSDRMPSDILPGGITLGDKLGGGGYHDVYDVVGRPDLVARVKKPETISKQFVAAGAVGVHLDALIAFCIAQKAFPGNGHALYEFYVTLARQLHAATDSVSELLDDLKVISAVVSGGGNFYRAVMIQDGRRRMRNVFSSPLLVSLLPSVVTTFDDTGQQLVSKCYTLMTQGHIEWPKRAPEKLADFQIAAMAAVFLKTLSDVNGLVPFFDGKMNNLGVEKRGDGSLVLRIIDVDVDDQVATIQSFTPGNGKNRFNDIVFAHRGPRLNYYQSLFGAIVAILGWVSDAGLIEKALCYNFGITPSAAPDKMQSTAPWAAPVSTTKVAKAFEPMAWASPASPAVAEFWAAQTSAMPRLQRIGAEMSHAIQKYPLTVAAIDKHFGALLRYKMRVPDKFRAGFCDATAPKWQ